VDYINVLFPFLPLCVCKLVCLCGLYNDTLIADIIQHYGTD